MPILDVLQPNDLNIFKQRFKKISLGQFDQARFEIQSQHQAISGNNALKLEFIPSQEEDAVQLTIDYQVDLTTPANSALSEKVLGWVQLGHRLIVIYRPTLPKQTPLFYLDLPSAQNEFFNRVGKL